jgi:hypothetical protein
MRGQNASDASWAGHPTADVKGDLLVGDGLGGIGESHVCIRSLQHLGPRLVSEESGYTLRTTRFPAALAIWELISPPMYMMSPMRYNQSIRTMTAPRLP